MCVISVAIQKGGSGKTTTVVNLGAALQRKGKSVLLIDADPQTNLTQSLGIREDPVHSILTELNREISGEGSHLPDAIVTTASGLELVPSSLELAGTELELVSVYGREQVFSWMLEKWKGEYDYVLIDCPPSIGLLTVNALVASDLVLMPLQAEFLPLAGLRSFMHHFKSVRKINKKLEILGFVVTHYDERRVMNRESNVVLEQEFGEKTFHTHIRNNIRLANAQQAGTDIFHFDPHCHGAEDYDRLADEFLEKVERAAPAQVPELAENTW